MFSYPMNELVYFFDNKITAKVLYNKKKKITYRMWGKSVCFKIGSAQSTAASTDVRKWATRRVLFETLKEYTLGGACRIWY